MNVRFPKLVSTIAPLYCSRENRTHCEVLHGGTTKYCTFCLYVQIVVYSLLLNVYIAYVFEKDALAELKAHKFFVLIIIAPLKLRINEHNLILVCDVVTTYGTYRSTF